MINASDKGHIYEIACIDGFFSLILKSFERNDWNIAPYTKENTLELFYLTCQRYLNYTEIKRNLSISFYCFSVS